MFTDEQNKKIKKYKKVTRPSYYDASTKSEVVISEEFESFLILLDENTKTTAINQINSIKNLNNTRKDRDELLALALSSEIADSQTLYNSLNTEFKAFDDFITAFAVKDIGQVAERGVLITNMQDAHGERLVLRDRMQHLNIYLTFINTNTKLATSETLKELDSWITVISEYKGLT